jgi:hypothetical protein
MAAPRDQWQVPPAAAKDDSYRSTNWEPCLPVDLPEFLVGLIAGQIEAKAGERCACAGQIEAKAGERCACAGQHGGSGHYVFLGPDSGHYRRSNYARRVFRPACDGRHESTRGRPAHLVIADTTVWPGVPVAAWPAAQPVIGPETRTDAGQHADFTPPRGRGIPTIPERTPLACWLPLKLGLTPHGLRHSHKTWMAEDGIPEILAEQRLGHEVPGMRGLYAHASAGSMTCYIPGRCVVRQEHGTGVSPVAWDRAGPGSAVAVADDFGLVGGGQAGGWFASGMGPPPGPHGGHHHHHHYHHPPHRH